MPRFRPHIGWISPVLVAGLALTGCAATLDRDEALTVVPYTVQLTGRILVDVRLNDAGPFRFAIDTAATGSFVSARVRERLALELLPGVTNTVYGAVATGSYPVVEVARLVVGDVEWTDARLVVLSEPTFATTMIDGLLGADFLRRFAVGFSVRDGALRLYRPETVGERAYGGWSAVPMQPRTFGNAGEPLHFLDIAIDGHRVPALLDLGAGISMLNTPAARDLRLTPIRREQTGEFAGALGSEPLIAQLGRQDVETGRVSWRNEIFLIADPEIFRTLGYTDRPLAILGSGLFSQRDFVIDFARNRLLIRSAMSEMDAVAGQ